MEALINKTDVEKRVQVGIGYNDKNFQQFTREAQEFDLKPLLCEDFYMSLFSLSDADKEKIFNGGEYEYNTKTYTYWGLSDVLSYFTYARFLMKSPIVSTTHGIVKKKTPESEPADLGEEKICITNTDKKQIRFSKASKNLLKEQTSAIGIVQTNLAKNSNINQM